MRYCVGDVHSCSQELKILLEKITNEDPQAVFYSLGDLVNKGPDPLGVMELVRRYQIQFIRGNHEDWLLRIWDQWLDILSKYLERELPLEEVELYLKAPLFDSKLEAFIHQGPREKDNIQPTPLLRPRDFVFLKSFEGQLHLHISHLRKAPYWIDLPEALLIHAGLDPSLTKLSDMNPRVLTTIRTWGGVSSDLNNPLKDPPWYQATTWHKPVIFGHWAQLGLYQSDRFTCLDSGCVYGGSLSALCLETHEITQVEALEVYCPVE